MSNLTQFIHLHDAGTCVYLLINQTIQKSDFNCSILPLFINLIQFFAFIGPNANVGSIYAFDRDILRQMFTIDFV